MQNYQNKKEYITSKKIIPAQINLFNQNGSYDFSIAI